MTQDNIENLSKIGSEEKVESVESDEKAIKREGQTPGDKILKAREQVVDTHERALVELGNISNADNGTEIPAIVSQAREELLDLTSEATGALFELEKHTDLGDIYAMPESDADQKKVEFENRFMNLQENADFSGMADLCQEEAVPSVVRKTAIQEIFKNQGIEAIKNLVDIQKPGLLEDLFPILSREFPEKINELLLSGDMGTHLESVAFRRLAEQGQFQLMGDMYDGVSEINKVQIIHKLGEFKQEGLLFSLYDKGNTDSLANLIIIKNLNSNIELLRKLYVEEEAFFLRDKIIENMGNIDLALQMRVPDYEAADEKVEEIKENQSEKEFDNLTSEEKLEKLEKDFGIQFEVNGDLEEMGGILSKIFRGLNFFGGNEDKFLNQLFIYSEKIRSNANKGLARLWKEVETKVVVHELTHVKHFKLAENQPELMRDFFKPIYDTELGQQAIDEAGMTLSDPRDWFKFDESGSIVGVDSTRVQYGEVNAYGTREYQCGDELQKNAESVATFVEEAFAAWTNGTDPFFESVNREGFLDYITLYRQKYDRLEEYGLLGVNGAEVNKYMQALLDKYELYSQARSFEKNQVEE